MPTQRTMKTLGIDLAAQDLSTAACLIDWSNGQAEVEQLADNQSNEQLAALAAEVDWIGVDVPFGWPAAAIEAITDYSQSGRWNSTATTQELSFRETDRLVHERAGFWPLSVSSNFIAITAWRGAQLLTLLAEAGIDRIGCSGVVEVYPGAALELWDFDRTVAG